VLPSILTDLRSTLPGETSNAFLLCWWDHTPFMGRIHLERQLDSNTKVKRPEETNLQATYVDSDHPDVAILLFHSCTMQKL
jgi:hypothetical protein